jgi:Protein of unknown function (DUF2971)
MSSPRLYKYLDVQGAKLTLGNKNFKHAKPSDFNDLEELTVRSIFPEDEETALREMESGFTDVIMGHLDDPPTCLNAGLRDKVALLQAIFKANPGAARLIKEAKTKGQVPEVFDPKQMKARNAAFVDEINQHMQSHRILCVSECHDSEEMWNRYAEGHKGIVLRITPNVAKDSEYQLFAAVSYHDSRPALYDSVLDFQEGSLFGDQQQRIHQTMRKIIYTKTLPWSYEREYRLAIPLKEGEDWNTMPYHPEEISELYLGANQPDALKAEIVKLAQAVNPEIKIFDAAHGKDGKLTFRPR